MTTAMDEPRVAIVVLNWRRPQETVACVSSIMQLDYGNIDIIICDNDSGDGSIESIIADLQAALPGVNEARNARSIPNFTFRNVPPDLQSIDAGETEAGRLWIAQTGRNGGYAFGNNVGIRLALLAPQVEYVWVLNNDTAVDAGALRPLIAKMTADPAIGICGAKVLYSELDGQIQTLGGGRFLPSRARCEQIGEGLAVDKAIDAQTVEAQMSYVNGAAALVRRDLIEQVGYMDEGYFLYWEELDWATRALASGKYRLGYCADAIVYHQVGASTGSNDHGIPSLGSTYWMTRSKFRYLRLHRPRTLLIAFPLLLKAVAKEVRAGRRERAGVMLRAALNVPMKT